MHYLAGLGAPTGAPAAEPGTDAFRSQLRLAMTRIQEYEQGLVGRLLGGLESLKAYQVWGIRDTNRLAERVPTIAITLPDKPSSLLARFLADREIYAWSGNMYAQNLSEKLGLEDRGGFLRLGMVHSPVDGTQKWTRPSRPWPTSSLSCHGFYLLIRFPSSTSR